MRLIRYKVLILLSVSLFSISCAREIGVSNNQSSASATDNIVYSVESAVAAANSSINDVEQISNFAFKPVKSFFNLAYASSCGLSRYSPVIGIANCGGTENNRTVLESFSNCTAGSSNEFIFNGSVKLAFDSNTTCDTWITGSTPTSGSVQRTTNSFTRSNSDGSSIVTDSNSHVPYDSSTSIGGGVLTTFSSNTSAGLVRRFVSIDGLHRVRKTNFDSVVYDHLIKTTSVLDAAGSRSADNRQVSGTIVVYNNTAKYKATHVLNQIKWTMNCCYPTSGSITTTTTGSLTSTYSTDFGTGTCGEVSMTTDNSTALKVKLAACE